MKAASYANCLICGAPLVSDREPVTMRVRKRTDDGFALEVSTLVPICEGRCRADRIRQRAEEIERA